MTEKVVISDSEVAGVVNVPESPQKLDPRLPSAIPVWIKFGMSLLVLVLPVLCLVAIVIRTALRNQSPRAKHAWASYLSTLLIISGFLTSLATVVVVSMGPRPFIGNPGLVELDERSEFPTLPAITTLSGSDISHELKPLVLVVSPILKSWLGEIVETRNFGAGSILEANERGYLIATARHVPGDGNRALVATSSGVWGTAEVIARHRDLDLALIFVPRHSGHSRFLQPIAPAQDGAQIYVIGHPQGLLYTLSTGIISREERSVVQISAPISPGNSGGPVYDAHGGLVAIVSSTMDKGANPNAENLNFAVSAEAMRGAEGWVFTSSGEKYRDQFDIFKQSAAH